MHDVKKEEPLLEKTISFKSIKDYEFRGKQEFDALYSFGKLINKNSSCE